MLTEAQILEIAETLESGVDEFGRHSFDDADLWLLPMRFWRLPTTRMLHNLPEDSRLNMRGKWFWSSDCGPMYPDCAWKVYFGNGYTRGILQDAPGYVRLVRDVGGSPNGP